MDFKNIEVPPIEEGSCLLRNYALEKIRTDDQEVVIFHYAAALQRTSESDSDKSNVARVENIGKRLNLLQGRVDLYVADEKPSRIKPEYLSEDEAIVKYVPLFLTPRFGANIEKSGERQKASQFCTSLLQPQMGSAPDL